MRPISIYTALLCGTALVLPASALAQASGEPAGAVQASPEVQSNQSETPSQSAGSSGETEEIIVTGVRASLQRAADIKRRSDVVVDSIASEDLGKFPDANVAESLQRITGVAIDRNSGGEGQFVTVRGFGPSFNTVLLNGRSVPTQTTGRAFSFDLLPSELISGADVYKSAQASVQEGGIGATINVRTPRPFDFDGFKAVVSAKGLYEDLSGKAGPQLFGLVSQRFMDDRIGVLLSASYQRRQAQTDSVTTGGYLPHVDLPSAGITDVNMPQQIDYNQQRDKRTRLGFNGVIQFEASDALKLTVDGLWNRYKVDSHVTSLGYYFSPTAVASAVLDGNRTTTQLVTNPLSDPNTGHTDFIDIENTGPTLVRAVGFNAAWEPTDRLSLTFDSSLAKTTSTYGGGGQFGSKFTVLGFPNIVTYNYNGSGVPSVSTSIVDHLDPSLAKAHFSIQQYQDVSDRIFDNHLDGKYRFGDVGLTELRFGAFATSRKKANTNMQTDPTVLCSYCGYNIPAPASLLTPYDLGSSYMSGYPGTFPRQFLTMNSDAVFAFLESKAAADAQDAATGKPIGSTFANIQKFGGYGALAQPDSYQVKEKTYGAYLEAAAAGALGGMDWSANVGLRFVHTDSTVNGLQLVLQDLRLIQGDATMFLGEFAGTPAAVAVKSKYDNLLPSANFKLNVTDRLIVRVGASKSVARPNLTDLAPRISFTQFRPGNLTAGSGNPALKPYQSTNFDASFEWYYNRSGFFTVGLFHKQIKDFIVSTVGPQVFPVANADGNFPGGTATFNVRRPQNSRSTTVKGVEVALQHTFDWLPSPFDGLGFLVNATFVKSGAHIDPLSPRESFALEGLGNSQNAQIFYEKGRFSTRFSYNHRDSFLQTLANPIGGDPIHVKSQGQLDFQASYRVWGPATIFVEGTNITSEAVQSYGLYKNEYVGIVNTGARYAAGVRATF